MSDPATGSTRTAQAHCDGLHRRVQPLLRGAALVLGILCGLLTASQAIAQTSQPRTVDFPSADGKTTLIGYLFAPQGRPKSAPAVVMMHGRGGVYSSLAKGNYSSVTLSKQMRNWAELWSSQGYWALVVDSFGPRGYPAGIAAGSTDTSRPAASGETAIRPLDAYGALRYLRASSRVKPDRIALQGWSNGGTATLASMTGESEVAEVEAGHGFRAALAIYPGCALQDRLKNVDAPYAPVHIFIGARDEVASTPACEKLAAAAKAAGGNLALTVFEGATHDFDDPAHDPQDVLANVAATSEMRRQSIAFLASALGH